MSEKPVSDALAGVGEVVKMGAGNAHMRRAGDNLAQGLAIVTDLVKTVLMPLAVVNARAQAYFDTKFPEQLAERLVDVPPASVTTPRPSVAGPAMQGLNYSHEETELRDLYLSLLATAMDGRNPNAAHPAFAEIISALSSAEVEFLDHVLKVGRVTIADLRVTTAGAEGYRSAGRHITPLERDGVPLDESLLPAYIDNWVRLGIVTADYTVYAIGEHQYEWVQSRPAFRRLEAALLPGQRVTFERGLLEITAFGRSFAAAVQIL